MFKFFGCPIHLQIKKQFALALEFEAWEFWIPLQLKISQNNVTISMAKVALHFAHLVPEDSWKLGYFWSFFCCRPNFLKNDKKIRSIQS